PQLPEMKAILQEGLGMIESPRLTSFYPDGYGVALVFFGLVPYAAFASSTGRSPFLAPAHSMHSYISPTMFKYTFAATCVIHVVESLYCLSLCWKYRISFRVMLQYLVCTFFLGWPALRDLKKRIRKASVMKAE
ncbi:hypothetical protein B0H14DRAFT_2344836, partial [Mycena olivaceomarginata]